MKKSLLSVVTPKSLRRKGDVKKDTMVVKTLSSQKSDAAKLSRNKSKILENTSSMTSSTSTIPTTTLYKPVADNKSKSKLPVKDEKGNKEEGGGNGKTHVEDIEYDGEVVRKLLERKVEQAPAAKVVVSDAMMREALTEMNLQKVGVPKTAVSSTYSTAVDNFSNKEVCGNGLTKDRTEGSSSASILAGAGHHQGTDKVTESLTNCVGGGDATACMGSSENEPNLNMNAIGPHIQLNENDSLLEKETGCPLEKIIEFLQAVMTKDYKEALVLVKEVEKHEPNNELVLEYVTVLKQIVAKEEEYDNDGSDSDSTETTSVDAGEFTDELTTSSETDDTSEEDSESFTTESRSSSASTTSSEEDDEDEEGYDAELETTDSKDNKIEEYVLVETDMEGKSVDVGKDTTSCGLSEHEELSKGNDTDARPANTAEAEGL